MVIHKKSSPYVAACKSVVTAAESQRQNLVGKAQKRTRDVYKMTAEKERHSAFISHEPAALLHIVPYAHLRFHRIYRTELAVFLHFERFLHHRIKAIDIPERKRQLLILHDIQQFIVFVAIAAAGLVDKQRLARCGKLLGVVNFVFLSNSISTASSSSISNSCCMLKVFSFA